MKHLSTVKLSETVVSKRKAMKLSQSVIAERTGINRSLLSRLETGDYTPSVDQLLALSEVLDFDYKDLFVEDESAVKPVDRKKIAVAGTGYVGLSLAVLLSQHNDVTAVDIVPEKVEKLNNWQSPIQDDFIEQYLAEHEERGLSLTATTDGESAYKGADFIIVAAPTNYDPKTNFLIARRWSRCLLSSRPQPLTGKFLPQSSSSPRSLSATLCKFVRRWVWTISFSVRSF